MGVKDILEKINLLPDMGEFAGLKERTFDMEVTLKNEIRKQGISAEVFVGGSMKKGTIVRSNDYDIDIFVRFSKKYEDEKISGLLERVIKKIDKHEKIHGSRDYFRIKRGDATFEIIPVRKIGKPKEAKNVTDLSYFHVNYVKKKTKNEKILGEIVLAKQFCKAAKVYGAESYVSGFSGYALECLIIYYKTFEKMLKGLLKTKDKIVIDIEKKYKNKHDIFIEMNEAKRNSPIILVDPTFKERNILAALSNESFEKFRKRAREFLKKPSDEFFAVKKTDIGKMKNEAKKERAEFLHIKLKTDRQEGDIAGTKMRKFSKFLEKEISAYFDIARSEFEYPGKKEADFYIVARAKKEIIKKGPPAKMKENAAAFKKANKDMFEENGIFYARVKVNYSLRDFMNNFEKENLNKIKEMGIMGLEVI